MGTKRTVVIGISGILLVAGLSGCASDGGLFGPTGAPVSTSMSASSDVVGVQIIPVSERVVLAPISGKTLADKELSTSSYAGSVMVINNWASWCAPCRDETPQLVSAANSLPEAHFMGINVKDHLDAALAFVAEFKIPYPSLNDSEGQLITQVPGVPAAALPSTVIVDKQGRIAVRIIGPIPADALVPLVQSVAAEV